MTESKLKMTKAELKSVNAGLSKHPSRRSSKQKMVIDKYNDIANKELLAIIEGKHD
jgi:hypothetical protein